MATKLFSKLGGIDPEKHSIEPPSYASTAYIIASYARMALVSFLLFCKNLGNLREFFGQMVYRPPWQKIARTPMALSCQIWGQYCKATILSSFSQSLFPTALQNLRIPPFVFDITIPLFSIERNEKLKLVFDLPTAKNRLSFLRI